MIRRPPRSTRVRSSAASDVYKRQGVEKAAVAVDREHRHVGPRVLRAERGGVAPAEIVLITGREKRARLVDRHGEAGGEADLRDLVDINAVLRQLSADDDEEGELRAKLVEACAQLGLALLHFVAARGAARIMFRCLL